MLSDLSFFHRLEETAAAATMALRGEICVSWGSVRGGWQAWPNPGLRLTPPPCAALSQTTDNSQKAYIERHSYNVVLSMAPWNAPTGQSTARPVGSLACAPTRLR